MYRVVFLSLLLSFFALTCRADENTNFVLTEHYQLTPEPGMLAEIGLAIGLTDQQDAYSIALITGADQYPLLGRQGETLLAAKTDRVQLVRSFKDLGFNELIVVWNEDFNQQNLQSVLRNFVDPRLKAHRKSRFLLAHSGHGISHREEGYLLTARSESFDDVSRMLSLSAFKELLKPTMNAAYQGLVLLNSCYGGALVSSFGGRFIPKNPGSHAITAGGSNELTWGTERQGSIFFDTVLRGLSGAADTLPKDTGGDGIITTFELYSFLRQTVQSESNQVQNPDMGKLRPDNNTGEFFFPVSRRIADNRPPPDDTAIHISFGTENLLAYRGHVTSSTASTSIGLTSTLPEKIDDQVIEGGVLDLSVLYDKKSGNIYYRDIAFRSEDISYGFSQDVEVGLLQPVSKKVRVDLDFKIYVRLDQRSPPIRVKSGTGGEFELDRFTTAECDFRCYDIEIAGRWFIEVNGRRQEGRISTHNNGRGVGADIEATVSSRNFPKVLTFSKLRWHGNHNTFSRSFPPLVDEEVDGVSVRVEAPRISFNGISALQNGEYENVELQSLN